LEAMMVMVSKPTGPAVAGLVDDELEEALDFKTEAG
jgi:hypothetical protein